MWETALSSAIQVAIAIAGFSGIVAALDRRAAGHWTESDQLALRMLLTASSTTLIFAFLPFVLIDLVSSQLTWRACSGLFFIYLVGITVLRRRQAQGTWPLRVGRWQFLAMQSIVVLVLLANTVWFASPSVYLFAVVWGLLVAFLAFITLLLESWRPPPTSTPPGG